MKTMLCALLAVGLLAAGCGGSEDNNTSDFNSTQDSVDATAFETIAAGDSEDEVRERMGEPTVVTDFGTGTATWEWCTDEIFYSVSLSEGEVTDTETGEMSAARCVG